MKKGILFFFFFTLLCADFAYSQVENAQNQADSNITLLDNKAQKKYKKELEKKHRQETGDTLNFFQKTWYKVFPKKVERDVSYAEVYKEKPKTIMVMYPWNRSKEQFADEMFYVS